MTAELPTLDDAMRRTTLPMVALIVGRLCAVSVGGGNPLRGT